MSGKDSRTLSEIELEERVKKRREPLRKPSYDEEKRKKERAASRKVARSHMRLANADLKPEHKAVQSQFDTSFSEALLTTPTKEPKRRKKKDQFTQPKPRLSEEATESMESEAQIQREEEAQEEHEAEQRSEGWMYGGES